MKKIVFVTGTRADYGKIKSIIQKLSYSKKYKIFIFVTGMHLLRKYARTYLHIFKDFKTHTSIFLSKNQKKNEPQDIILSRTIKNFSKYIDKIKPNLIIVHGDRLEALAGSLVGTLKQYLVAHIEGGEISGTVDEHMRHAISKLSHIHFVANKLAKNLLIHMGENKKRVFIVGSPDIDIMASKNIPDFYQVKKRYNIKFDSYALAIMHPNPLNLKKLPSELNSFCEVIKKSQLKYVLIYPNNDPGSDYIINFYKKKFNKNKKIRIIKSMRFEYFISLLKNSKFIIGNSSVGIRETPFFGIPTVDLGDRQKFRTSSLRVKNFKFRDKKKILTYINILDNKSTKFTKSKEFGSGRSSEKIFKILNSKGFWNTDVQKHFMRNRKN
ncbi:MAG: UDP-N-acetylglucosamine 2-epimerase (hydrolyzing) [Pelagibacterales bacterium]|nr:UDP-N-acetylglucosamine 2-epimerase (hydrolyzing) [Pelagibacterales bacterium]